MSQKSYQTNQNKLYLIPTPIGNMDDITFRALKTLEMVDLILCEDTRVTEQLLAHFHLHKRLLSCHDHNEDKMQDKVLQFLQEALNIGLVTDRGTPIISDPGYKIVSYVVQNGYDVISLPGPTALIPALTMSGLNPSPFLFYGFTSSKYEQKRRELASLARLPYTLIFYESPHRIIDTLTAFLEVFGDREIAICREISKLYEEVYRGTISQVIQELGDAIKGELVIVVSGNLQVEDYSSLSIIEHVQLYMEDGLSSKEAIKKVALERDLPKSVVYKEYHMGE